VDWFHTHSKGLEELVNTEDAIKAVIAKAEEPAFGPLAEPFEFRGETYKTRRPNVLTLLYSSACTDSTSVQRSLLGPKS
jgi:hypothetical protein